MGGRKDPNRRRRQKAQKKARRKAAQEDRKRRREKAQSQSGVSLDIHWPGSPASNMDNWTEGEVVGLSIHPMVTGLGQHPRTVSDNDYVMSCQRIVNDYGAATFTDGLLQVLHETAHPDMPWVMPVEKNQPVPASPRVRENVRLPMPRPEMPGDRTIRDQWTEGMVLGLMLNPVVTGVFPFEPVIEPEKWKIIFERQLDEVGVKQIMVDLLYVLRWTYGAPGIGPGHIPYGYQLVESEDGEYYGSDGTFDDWE